MMFEGKSVLVTGSARNVGLGIAKVFAGYGATVFINNESAEEVEQVVAVLNRDAGPDQPKYLPAAADVTREDEVARAFGLFEGQLAVSIHSGSRGLGHQVCGDYVKELQAASVDTGSSCPTGSWSAPR